jgi:translocation and assembly module TamA
MLRAVRVIGLVLLCATQVLAQETAQTPNLASPDANLSAAPEASPAALPAPPAYEAFHEEDIPSSESTPIKPYRILMNAPSEVYDYLEDYMDLYRYKNQKDLSEEYLFLLADRAEFNVQTLLKTLGYFSARAKATLEKDEDGDYLVRVQVTPGAQVMVRDVKINVVGALAENPQAMARFEAAQKILWKLPVGKPFNQNDWATSKQNIINFVSGRSYATAKVTKSEARINAETQSATLIMNIDSGPAYVFGAVAISGFKRYPQSLVENRNTIVEGNVYSQYLLRNLQTDLQGLPYFNGVIVEGHPSVSEPWQVPVSIQVDEAPRNTLDLSVGFSRNNGPHVVSQYSFYNIAHRGWIFDSTLDLSRDSKTGEIGLTFPRHRSGYDHRIYASIANDDTQGWTSHTRKIGAMRARAQGNIDRTLFLEHIREKRHDDYSQEESLVATPLGFRWSKVTAMPRNNPRRGYHIQGEAQAAVRGAFTDESFVRLYARGSNYWGIGTGSVAMARVEVGQTFSNHPDKVPTEALFRAGGSGSVRGYDYQSLGIQHGSSTLPGRVLATASLEYQQSVIEDWRAAVFVDYGDAADRWTDWDGKTGVGVGARWQSPVGTLGADIAYGVDDRRWRFYLSLGIAL